MIGKIIADWRGWTEKLGGEKNGKFEELVQIYMDDSEWDNFQAKVKAADGNEIKIKAAIDDTELQQLKNLDGLYDYAVKQSQNGKDVDLGDVNNLIKTQNYTNIANQAQGFKGVNTAIKEYNKLTDTASKSKLAETISTTNTSLGKYLTGLNGADAGLGSYAGSLVTATAKTFALQAATMAMNAAISMGVSFLVSAIASWIDSLVVTKEEIKEAAEEAKSAIDTIKSDFDNLSSSTDDIKERFAELAQGVENLGKVNQSRGTLSTDDYDEFLDLSNQLAELFPQLKKGCDDNGNAILGLSGNVDTIVGSLDNLVSVQQKLANQQILEEMPDVWSGYTTDLDEYTEELDNAEKNVESYQAALNKLSNMSGDTKIKITSSSVQQSLIRAAKNIGLDDGDWFGNSLSALYSENRSYSGKGLSKFKSAEWDFSSLTESQIDQLKNELGSLASEYEDAVQLTKSKISSANSEMSSYINTWLSTGSGKWNFTQLSSDMQNLVKDVLINSDWISSIPKTVDSSKWDEVSNWLEQDFLYAINQIDDSEIQTALLNTVNGDFSVEELQNVISQLLETEGFDKDNPLILWLQTQIDNKEDLIEQIQDKFSFLKAEDLETLNLEDLEFAVSLDIEIPKSGMMSWDEFIAKLEEAKTEQEALIASSTTFAEALKSSSDYADYLEEFQSLAESGGLSSEVLSSTEEYADLLQNLGYSAEDAVSSLKELFGILDYGNMMDGLEDSLTDIINAQLELADGGKLSFDTVQALLDIQPDFIEQLEAVEGGYITTDAALQSLIDTKLQNIGIDNNEAIDAANKVISACGGETIAYGLETDEIIKQIEAQISLLKAKQIAANAEAEEKLKEELLNSSDYKLFSLQRGNWTSYVSGEVDDTSAKIIENVASQYATDYSDDIADLENIIAQLTDRENALEIYNELIPKITDSYNSSSSSSSSSDSSQTFDLIETKIDNLSTTLDALKTKADDTYSLWTKRNTELTNAISKTKEAINLQSQAYNRYIQEADSVGLSDTWKNLVQNGAIDINTISDETLKTQISDYQTWYEKAQECLKTQEDLNSELNELKTQKFDNIKSEYDAVISRMQSAYDLLKSQLTLLSSSGDYDTLRSKQTDIVTKLQAERNALQSNLNSSDMQQYTEAWYNLVSQIDDIDSQILDAQNTLKDIDNLQFDNIQEAFDFDTSVLEYGLQIIQNKIDLLELKGQFANESYYNGMIEYAQKQLDTLKNERTQLQNILNSTLYKQGTSEWNDMYSALMDIDEEIDSMTSSLVEYNNAIRDLNWEIFEYLEESINRITDETEYLIELLSNKELYDENGQISDYGTASIALHAAAYDTYKQQAQDYYEEVQDLQRQLVNGAGQDVLEQYNEMVEAHRDAVLAAEEEKEAILDLIEDGYNAQLDAFQELIDKKKEALSAEKDLHDYQKSISEQTANIASLEKQQLAYEDDTSEEAMSKIQQLKISLEEAKADLQETEYKQYLSDTEDMLDRLAEDYENWMNDRLDNSDALLAEIVSTVAGKGDEINATLNEVAEEYGTFISDTITSIFDSDSPFTSTLTQGFTDINTQLSNNLTNVSTSIAGTTAAIDKLVAQVANLVNVEANKTNAGSSVNNSSSTSASSGAGSTSNGTSNSSPDSSKTSSISTSSGTSSNTSSTSKISSPVSSSSDSKTGKALLDSILISKRDSYPKGSLNIDTSVVDRLKYNDKDSSFSARSMYWSKIFGGTYTGSSAQNTKLLNYLKSNGYKSGTSNATKGYHWTQEDGEEIIYRASDGAILTPLSQGDMVFDNESSQRLWEMAQGNFIPNIAPIQTPDFSKIGNMQNTQSMNIGDINVNMDLPNVTNYSDFRNQLIKDSTFEKAMFTSINHALTGKGTSLDKLRYTR